MPVRKADLRGLLEDRLPGRLHGEPVRIDQQHVAIGVVARGQVEVVLLVDVPEEEITSSFSGNWMA